MAEAEHKELGNKLLPCAKCGGDMRLGATKIRFNRRQGVAHYIAHLGGYKLCDAAKEYADCMFKPYPKNPAEKSSTRLIKKWNADQSAALRSSEQKGA